MPWSGKKQTATLMSVAASASFQQWHECVEEFLRHFFAACGVRVHFVGDRIGRPIEARSLIDADHRLARRVCIEFRSDFPQLTSTAGM